MTIAKSELILNEDGSIYHLNLKPEQLAKTIITVGDPDRVAEVTTNFDTIECKVQKREFHTQTGTYRGKRITVISTGIGTDNIDIVFNELDALANIDFNTRKIKEEHTSLNIIRIGTSGAIQADIPIDSFVVTQVAIGFDSLLHYYNSKHIQFPQISESLMKHLNWDTDKSSPYVVTFDKKLGRHMRGEIQTKGFTATNIGFYGPQGRILRIPLSDPQLNEKLTSFEYADKKIANLEMETAGIYGMAKLLGHRAVSMNAILANRITGEFSKNPKKTVDTLIKYTLDKIISYQDEI
ncbi:nucleoside phosphorylase [Aquimarina sp. RZ0]|uniref:nucleoside phosphorylase n=1 Tax=Aquimarina sp. RZ0 TaxID=2607730 RepID=UPI0011F0B0AC|nr:nucleoside phosphorylase [Aquimarina sp. RZ0]KAA1246957.1 phosphorylase [Aquimarina sp. RZ0]